MVSFRELTIDGLVLLGLATGFSGCDSKSKQASSSVEYTMQLEQYVLRPGQYVSITELGTRVKSYDATLDNVLIGRKENGMMDFYRYGKQTAENMPNVVVLWREDSDPQSGVEIQGQRPRSFSVYAICIDAKSPYYGELKEKLEGRADVFNSNAPISK